MDMKTIHCKKGIGMFLNTMFSVTSLLECLNTSYGSNLQNSNTNFNIQTLY